MSSLVLVGFMGTGKTEVARVLSQRLGWPWLDTDDWIVRGLGKPVTRIFAEDGEAAFRAQETKTLRDLGHALKRPHVVATGGGIVLAAENWPLLHALGDVICLTAKPEVILQRVGAAADRPLLAGTPTEVAQRVRDLLAQRQAAYAQADWSCATDALTPAGVADRILGWRRERHASIE